MTDFIAELEAELLAAARRRATAGHRRRFPRPRLLPAVAVACAVLAAVVFALRPAPHEDVAPGGNGFAPAVMAPAVYCPQPPGLPMKPSADRLGTVLGLFRRERNAADSLPVHALGGPSNWLPVGDFDPREGVRHPAGLRSPVVVLSTNDVRTKPLPCPGGSSRGPGACMIAGGSLTERPRIHCFTLAEIRAGRAFALTGARLVGLVPDGPSAADVTVNGVTRRAAIVDNAVELSVGGLQSGERIAVALKARPPRVAVINETAAAGLATAMAEHLRTRLPVTATASASDTRRDRVRSVVRAIRPGSEPLARQVAEALGITRVGAPPPDAQIVPTTPDVIVVVGGDRMR